MKNKFPEHIMKFLRKRRGLDSSDITEDIEINSYSPKKAFQEILDWNLGYSAWADIIIKWMQDCKVTIKEKKDEEWKPANQPPNPPEGKWSKEVVVFTSHKRIKEVCFFNGKNEKYWEKTKDFFLGEEVMFWIEKPIL